MLIPALACEAYASQGSLHSPISYCKHHTYFHLQHLHEGPVKILQSLRLKIEILRSNNIRDQFDYLSTVCTISTVSTVLHQNSCWPEVYLLLFRMAAIYVTVQYFQKHQKNLIMLINGIRRAHLG